MPSHSPARLGPLEPSARQHLLLEETPAACSGTWAPQTLQEQARKEVRPLEAGCRHPRSPLGLWRNQRILCAAPWSLGFCFLCGPLLKASTHIHGGRHPLVPCVSLLWTLSCGALCAPYSQLGKRPNCSPVWLGGLFGLQPCCGCLFPLSLANICVKLFFRSSQIIWAFHCQASELSLTLSACG